MSDSSHKNPIRKDSIPKKKSLSAQEYIDGILAGNRATLSRAITLVESTLPKHRALAHEIIDGCIAHSGKSTRIGITGVPGVGKSTFIESLGKYLTNKGHKLAVLAIDPSSTQTKGSILGDKTRMEELTQDESAYIRPSPSAGSLGGVARKTRETVILVEAAGFDTIFIETVGVGQSETAVHSMVDFFLLLMLAGAGDELQGIKRGIMEMADAIAINKADSDNLKRATLAKGDYKRALHLFPPTPSGWIPRVETCSALEKENIDTVWGIVEEHQLLMKTKGFFEQTRKEQAKYWMHETIGETLLDNFYNNTEIKSKLKELEAQVLESTISPFKAANQLLELYKKL